MEIEVEGLAELEAKLLELGGKEARKVMRKSLRVGGNIVVADARTKVPDVSGALKESLGTMARKGKHKNFETMFVGPRMKNAKALALANRGRSKKIRGIFYGHMVEEGSINNEEPKPFLRPALDENANKVVRVFVTELNKGIARVTRR